MPIYEYQCDACGTRFERLQRLDEANPETCEKCGAAGPRRVLSSPAFQFKGAGWYVTDYARSGGAGGSSPKKEAGGDSGSSDNTTSEAKPATTAEPAKASSNDA